MFTIVSFDDILIDSKTQELHDIHVHQARNILWPQRQTREMMVVSSIGGVCFTL